MKVRGTNTHIVTLFSILFVGLTTTSISADAVDDTYAIHLGLYNGYVTDVLALSSTYSQSRIDDAQTIIGTKINPLLADILTIETTGTEGVAYNDFTQQQKDNFNQLQSDGGNLKDRTSDHVVLGIIQRDLGYVYSQLNSVSSLLDASGNLALVTSATTSADALDTFVTGTSMDSADSAADFTAESTRVTTGKDLADSTVPYLTKLSTLETTLAAVPTFTAAIDSFDSVIVASETAVVTATQALLDDTAILTGKSATIGSDVATYQTGVIAINDNAELEKKKAEIAILKGEIRILQLDLFPPTKTQDVTYTTSLASLNTKYASLQTKEGTFESDRADVIAAFTHTPNILDSTKTQSVDTAVTQFVTEVTSAIQAYSRAQAGGTISQTIIDAAVTDLQPIIYLRVTKDQMQQWISEIDFTSTNTTTANTEWDEFVALLNTHKTATTIPSSLLSSINTQMATSGFTSLFPDPDNTKKIFALISVATMASSIEAEFKSQTEATIRNVKDSGAAEASHSGTSSDPANATEAGTVPGSPDYSYSLQTTFTAEVLDSIGTGTSFLLSGDGTAFGRLREVAVDVAFDKINAGIKIFMNKSARIGLGTANLSTRAGQTLNVLGAPGSTGIRIIPDGNCYVDVNSDLIITGTQPIIPTSNFGKGATHRITFTSPVERQIVITRDTEWSLLDFNGTGTEYAANTKQIVFSGKVKLVLEPGAKIRFPYFADGSESKAPILYFNDDSELIFLGEDNRDGTRWTDGTGANAVRNKLIGCGQIWLNKNAKMKIYSPALVGIEADATSPKTDFTLSLQRHAVLFLGSEDKAGGALQIGNMTSIANSDIRCTLVMNGPLATCMIAREGFLGLCAGIVNKDSSNINGTIPSASTDLATIEAHGTQYDAWRVQRLHNVTNITLDITQGIFSHNNIVDGTNANSSLVAVGPLMGHYPASKYLLKLGKPKETVWRGGGTVAYLDSNREHTNPYPLSVWSTSADLDVTSSTANNGTYGLLTPAPVIRLRQETIPNITAYARYGRGHIVSSDTSFIFAGPQIEFFDLLRMHSYPDVNEKFVAFGEDDSDLMIGYVTGNTIKRDIIADSPSTGYINGLQLGYLISSGADDAGNPTNFTPPRL